MPLLEFSALDEDGTLLDFDYREVSIAKAILSNSRSTILVADSSKFERSAPMKIGNISEEDYFVTDKNPPERFIQICKQHHVEIIVSPAKVK